MTLVAILCFVLAALSLAAAIVGITLALLSRGQSRVRKGAEVHAEMMAESMARDNRGRPTIAQASIGYGTGVAWDRTAVYTLPEIKRAIRNRRYAAVLPALLGMGGLLGAILFAGAGLALVTTGNVRIVGLLLLAMAVYGSWMIGTDYLKTKA